MDKHVSDLDAERLFAGNSAAPDADEPLTRFAADVRATYVTPAAEPTRAAHLQALTETYSGLVASPTPVRGPRRRFVIRGTIAAAVLVLVGGSAMAATGTLPDIAQDAVSSVASRIGVKLPRSHRAEIRIVHPDVERSKIEVKTADTKTSSKNDDDDVSRSDDDSDSTGGITDTSGREPRRPRRDNDGGGTAVVKDPATPDDPDSDGDGGIGDDRGDPSDGGGDGGGSDPDPDDGTHPDPDDDGTDPDGDGGRGDPKDGSGPSGADSGTDDGSAPNDGSASQPGGRN